MGTLGLPVAFSTNKAKRTLTSKGRKNSSHKCVSGSKKETGSVNNTGLSVVISPVEGQIDPKCELMHEMLNEEQVLNFEGSFTLGHGCGEVHMNGRNNMLSICGLEVPDSAANQSDVGHWTAIWDEYYARYYFYNSETLDSIWEPPEGMEQFVALEGVTACSGNDFQNAVHVEGSEEVWGSNLLGYVNYGADEPCCSFQNEVDHADSEGVCGSNQLRHVNSRTDELDKHAKSMDMKKSPVALQAACINGKMLADKHYESCIPFKSSHGNLELVSMKMMKQKRKKHSKNILLAEKKEIGLQTADGCMADTLKYWRQRYQLFSRFDEGIQMDREGWFSATPECVAEHHASRCGSGVIIDCFTGVGGNAIQFAKRGNFVIAVDIVPQRVEYALHNAMLYGVCDNIEFIKGDFFQLAATLKGDYVFMSPPWGGPDYAKVETYDIFSMLKPCDGYFLFSTARVIASNIVMFLPRNTDLNQLAEIAMSMYPQWSLEVENNYLNGKLKAITAYFTEVSM